MDLWREELQYAIAQGLENLEDGNEEQLMVDIFLRLRSPTWSKRDHRLEAASLGRGMCIGIKKHAKNASLKDYFTENSTFDAMKFHQRYRMRCELFHHLVDAVCAFDPWFIRKCNALGRLGLSSLQKCWSSFVHSIH